MPGGDLVSPPERRSSHGADLDRVRLVLEVVSGAVHERDGQIGIVVVIDQAVDLLRVPGVAHLAVRIACVEELQQLVRPRSSRRSSAFVSSRRSR